MKFCGILTVLYWSRKAGTGYGSDASLGQTILVAAEAVVEDYVRTLHYASGLFHITITTPTTTTTTTTTTNAALPPIIAYAR